MASVVVRLYGILAAAAGTRVVEVDAGDCGNLRCVLERAARLNRGLARALEVVEWDVVLVAGGRRVELDDELDGIKELLVLPPASGGGRIVLGGTLEPGEELDLDELVEKLSGPGVGAVAIFVGVVRSPNEGEEVEYLDYDYDPSLTPLWLRRIAEEEASKHGLHGIAVYHYVGRRRPGERTMIVAVSADRRKRAFKALAEVVDRVKREAPIWKAERRGGKTYYHVGDRVIAEDEVKGGA